MFSSTRIRTASVIAVACMLGMALAPSLSRATGEEPAIKPGEKSAFDWLDKPRDFLSERFVSLSARMDNFFADERVFQEARNSFLRVYGDLSYSESRASDFTVKMQAKLVLPALQKRLKLLIESDDPTADNSAPTSSISTFQGVPNVDVPNDFRAGVQLQVADTPRWNVNTDAGVRIHGLALDPFVRARASRYQNVRDWQLRLSQAAYWFEQTGAGASVQFDADRRLGVNFLGRSRSVAVWSDHDQEFTFEQSFFLFQHIDEQNAMSYQLGIYGVSQPNSHVTAYNVAVKWRHRLHHEWLFGEIQPLLSWPEDQGFRPTTSILFRLEAVLGDVGCGCYGL